MGAATASVLWARFFIKITLFIATMLITLRGRRWSLRIFRNAGLNAPPPRGSGSAGTLERSREATTSRRAGRVLPSGFAGVAGVRRPTLCGAVVRGTRGRGFVAEAERSTAPDGPRPAAVTPAASLGQGTGLPPRTRRRLGPGGPTRAGTRPGPRRSPCGAGVVSTCVLQTREVLEHLLVSFSSSVQQE